MAIAGPQILILMPVWLTGVALHRIKIPKMPLAPFYVLFFCTFALYFGYKLFLYEKLPLFSLGYSSKFLNDYVVGGIVAINILSVKVISENKGIELLRRSWVANPIKKISSHTFSLYLYHFPLLLVFGAIFPDSINWYIAILYVCLVLAVIVSLSHFTEKNKYLYKKGIYRLYNLLSIRV